MFLYFHSSNSNEMFFYIIYSIEKFMLLITWMES